METTFDPSGPGKCDKAHGAPCKTCKATPLVISDKFVQIIRKSYTPRELSKLRLRALNGWPWSGIKGMGPGGK